MSQVQPYDYEYELTDDQLLRYSALPPIARLRWLDEARRFTLLARQARAAVRKAEAPGAPEYKP